MQRPFRTRIAQLLRRHLPARCRSSATRVAWAKVTELNAEPAFGGFFGVRRVSLPLADRLDERGNREDRARISLALRLRRRDRSPPSRACNGIRRKSGILNADTQARAASRRVASRRANPLGIRETRYSQYVAVIECAIAR